MADPQYLWIELLKLVPGIVTAITAIVGVSIAARGLNRWREETVGKRKAELAEEILGDFYQARDIIQSARHPLAYNGEGGSRKKQASETADEQRAKNAYYAPAERLHEKSEFFAAMNARRYRCQALFGDAVLKPYSDFRMAHNEVVLAVGMLLRTFGENSSPRLKDKWEATIWDGYEDDDPFRKRLDGSVKAIEDVCRPAIQESGPKLSRWPWM
jgi:hypothetical protein